MTGFFFPVSNFDLGWSETAVGCNVFQRLENELLYGRTERYRFEKVPTTR